MYSHDVVHNLKGCLCVVQLVMNVPFTAIHFATYESCKKLLSLEEDESLAVQLPAGGVAGGVSAALTTPLDVVKTRLQLEGVNSATRYGTTAVVTNHSAMHLASCHVVLYNAHVCSALMHSAACVGAHSTALCIWLDIGSSAGLCCMLF